MRNLALGAASEKYLKFVVEEFEVSIEVIIFFFLIFYSATIMFLVNLERVTSLLFQRTLQMFVLKNVIFVTSVMSS